MKTLHALFAMSLGLTAVLIATPAHAAVLTYIGASSDWFAPDNWDRGRVPGPGDDVIVDGRRTVVIDPTAGSSEVVFRDLTIRDGATLETLAGVQITTRNETLRDGGRLFHRSTRALDDALGGTLTVLPPSVDNGSDQGGLVFNPTPKSKRDIILVSTVTFGLGGERPASHTIPNARGPGYYATLTTERATLGGTLNLALFYDFVPAVGQTFQLINVGTTRTGMFDGLGEGAFVQRLGRVGLYISYVGGDGNDVVLTAGPLPRRAESATTDTMEGLQWARWDTWEAPTDQAAFMTFVVSEARLRRCET